jgi:hypothetical protein
MKDNDKVLSLRTHKTFLRKLIRDERLHPRLKLQAELLLGWLEEIYPRPLIESILKEQFGASEKTFKNITIEEEVDNHETSSLREELKELMGGENGSGTNSNTPDIEE